MMWVAIEDSDTYELSEFEPTTVQKALYLLKGYRVDKHAATKFRMHDVENGHSVVYEGVTYKGGFGYNILVAKKYAEL